MANHLIFSIGLCVSLCNFFFPVQSVNECQTNADCNINWISKVCCGSFEEKQRRCTTSCLHTHCSTDSDCGDVSMCCRSNKCVTYGCSGCTGNGDCAFGHVCCKKTFPLQETLCASDCINQPCKLNDDCGGSGECCRSGKCVTAGCSDWCTSNSDCSLGQYCCKKKDKDAWFWKNGCGSNCVGKKCDSDEDCGGPNECCISNKCVTEGCHGCNSRADCGSGHYCCKEKERNELNKCGANCIGKSCDTDDDCGGPNECCISNKCVTEGCHGCKSRADCGSGHYCCKKEQYELNECGANCIGKSCDTDDDCGGPSERCEQNNRCLPKPESISTKTESSKSPNSLPSWAIPVIVVCLVVFLIAVGVFVALFWYSKARRQTETGRGTVSLETPQRQAENAQPLLQFLDSNNPTAHREAPGLQNQPHNSGNNGPHEFYNPRYYDHQEEPTTAQTAQHQGVVGQNPSEKTWNRGIENPELCNDSENHQNQPAMVPNTDQAQSINNPVTTDTPHTTPQNTPHQQDDSGINNPPHNHQHQGNP